MKSPINNPKLSCSVSENFSDEKFQTQTTQSSRQGRVSEMRKFSRWAGNRWKCWHLIPGRISGADKRLCYLSGEADNGLMTAMRYNLQLRFAQLPFHGEGSLPPPCPDSGWVLSQVGTAGLCQQIVMGFSHQASGDAQNNHSNPGFLLNRIKTWRVFKGGFFRKVLYSGLFTL